MQDVFEKKLLNMKALDIDEPNKTVKVAIASIGNLDSDEDIFMPGAFNKTVKEQGPSGANLVYHLLDHEAKLRSSLGRFKELYVENGLLVGVNNYKQDWKSWEIAWPQYRDGEIVQHSVGFGTKRSQKNAHGQREIIEAYLLEGSAVLWGANSNTPTLDVAKSMIEQEDVIISGIKAYDTLINAIKAGKFDEDNGLMLIELKQLQQFAIDLSKITTQPEVASTAPVDEKQAKELYDEIKSLTHQLFK